MHLGLKAVNYFGTCFGDLLSSFGTLGVLLIVTWEESLVGSSMGLPLGYPLGVDTGLVPYKYFETSIGYLFCSSFDMSLGKLIGTLMVPLPINCL